MALLDGVVGGVGEGMIRLGNLAGEYVVRSSLQAEAAEIQKQRDQRLAELSEGAAVRAEDRKRVPYQRAAEKAKGLLASPVYDEDASGNVTPRARTAGEEARARAGAYEAEGLPDMASTLRREGLDADRIDTERRERALDRVERGADRDERREHHNALLTLQRATEGRLKAGADLDNAIKTIALDNARRVEKLRGEFGTATAERKQQITEEIQLLTGKDNDNYLPVPEGYDPMTGKPTSYRIFDKKRGAFVEGGAGGAGPGNRTGWDSSSKTVYVDGQPIAKANTEAEARALVLRHRGAGTPAGRGLLQSPVDPLDVEPAGFDQPPEELTPAQIRARNRRAWQQVPQPSYEDRFGQGL